MLARTQPEPSRRPLLAVGAIGIAAAAGIGWLLQQAWRPSADRNLRAAEALGAGAAILCLSVALDSGIEHYRGQFKDRAMFVGPTMAASGLAAATYIAFRPERARRAAEDRPDDRRRDRPLGLGFHIYNILKRPGEFDALNLFYGAPVGAPAALTLAGLYGVIAGEMLSGRDYVARASTAHRGADRLFADWHDRRSRAAALPRQLPESGNVRAGHRSAACGGEPWRGCAFAPRRASPSRC